MRVAVVCRFCERVACLVVPETQKLNKLARRSIVVPLRAPEQRLPGLSHLPRVEWQRPNSSVLAHRSRMKEDRTWSLRISSRSPINRNLLWVRSQMALQPALLSYGAGWNTVHLRWNPYAPIPPKPRFSRAKTGPHLAVEGDCEVDFPAEGFRVPSPLDVKRGQASMCAQRHSCGGKMVGM